MSHYPSSAELAAFRWPWPRTVPNDPMVNRPTLWELRYGTVQEAGQRDFAGDPARHSEMRAEASAMRSRAYHRMARDCDARWMLPVLDLLNPDGSYFGPWFEETHFGVPYTFHPSYLPA